MVTAPLGISRGAFFAVSLQVPAEGIQAQAVGLKLAMTVGFPRKRDAEFESMSWNKIENHKKETMDIPRN